MLSIHGPPADNSHHRRLQAIRSMILVNLLLMFRRRVFLTQNCSYLGQARTSLATSPVVYQT